ncbi:glycosyltransferase family 4 protein [Janibacter sp. DB-40]|uniref:glycosyltransferase family 4 protein n=1 Tax=Janibacter sp. DB-40 TaxID=3028808 RepID=UPI002405130F|nr:glycosyltransferase family 4 protein [Janibacter sp. DB-40]
MRRETDGSIEKNCPTRPAWHSGEREGRPALGLLPPRTGGIESQVSDLAVRLRAAGHEVEVFTATRGAKGERGGVVEEVDGVPVHRMALHLPGDLPVNPMAPPVVRGRLQDDGFDVAHVHLGVVSPSGGTWPGWPRGWGCPRH